MSEMLTTSQAGHLLGHLRHRNPYKAATIRQFIKTGELPGIQRPDGGWLVDRAHLERFAGHPPQGPASAAQATVPEAFPAAAARAAGASGAQVTAPAAAATLSGPTPNPGRGPLSSPTLIARMDDERASWLRLGDLDEAALADRIRDAFPTDQRSARAAAGWWLDYAAGFGERRNPRPAARSTAAYADEAADELGQGECPECRATVVVGRDATAARCPGCGAELEIIDEHDEFDGGDAQARADDDEGDDEEGGDDEEDEGEAGGEDDDDGAAAELDDDEGDDDVADEHTARRRWRR